MSGFEADGGEGTGADDRRLRRALGGVSAPPGMVERIRAALDAEDARRSRGEGPPRDLSSFRRPWIPLVLAASLLAVLAISWLGPRAPGEGRGTVRAGAGGRGTPAAELRDAGVTRVTLEGVVVCYDCAREGASLDYQAHRCQWPNHTNGLKTSDGRLVRFVLRDSLQETLLARTMRGDRVRVEGDLYPVIDHLDVASFVRLARCHAPALSSLPAVL